MSSLEAQVILLVLLMYVLFYRQLLKCGQSAAIKCASTCDRQLNCGKHFCKAVCHAGPCEKCEEKVQQGR